MLDQRLTVLGYAGAATVVEVLDQHPDGSAYYVRTDVTNRLVRVTRRPEGLIGEVVNPRP